MKVCTRCGTEKALEDFYARARASDGHVGICKACASALNREYRIRHAGRLRALQTQRLTRLRADDAEFYVKQNLWRMFRLTVDDYEMMLSAQGGVCAVCGTGPSATRRLNVDHDRTCCPQQKSCGRCVRGLLCTGCNNGTGIKDDPVLLRRRADYVDRWNAIARVLDHA
jgi:hypothetical protein